MNHGSLFSGIGGFDLAAECMEWKNIFHCEKNEFGKKILKYYWPKAISYNDIKTTDFTIHRGNIDVLSGGFPCQPFSSAGQRKGTTDDRYLWPEMLRAIREIQPRYVVGENVRGLTNWNGGLVFDQVQADLEAEGYDVLPFLLPACAVDAPHRRDRIWFVAQNPNSNGWGGDKRESKSDKREQWDAGTGNNEWLCPNNKEVGTVTNADSTRRESRPCDNIKQESIRPERPRKTRAITDTSRSSGTGQYKQQQESGELRGRDRENIIADTNGRRQPSQEYGQAEPGRTSETSLSNYWENFPTQPLICGGDDGLPGQLDGIPFPKWRNESIKAYGNAIVPQVALQIFQTIEKIK